MDFSTLGNDNLQKKRISFLEAFTKECRRSIIKMVKNSQSGHPGGALSSLDILATLYVYRISKTNEKVIISNGHISPGVYSVLGECGACKKNEAITSFRKFGSKFEGHITRHIPGVWYGTGPLGAGISAAAGFAYTEKQKGSDETVFGMIGDGEMQEGQVHEMALFAAHQKLDNFIIFVDWNRVQLSDSLESTLFIDPISFFKSKGWEVIEIDGHNYEEIWKSISTPTIGVPRAIIAKTIMGYGVPGMEEEGQKIKATWHGKAPKPNEADEMLTAIGKLSSEEKNTLDLFRKERNFSPEICNFPELGSKLKINIGNPKVYEINDITDCRSAYGNALADLAEKNISILGMTADLGGSVKTSVMKKTTPKQHIEFGICEQNMVSAAGGMSLNGYIPFCSTFGAFMTSRAKDQARVNDINHCNVKMVSTHCGLSVGEDGPTHQAIDDAGSMLGLLNTLPIEPADPNHCDRIIRYVASHFGNFYVRMGRAKLKTLTAESGEIFFNKNYEYSPGRCDVLREGTDITIIASGPMVHEALKARSEYENPEKIEIIIASSIKKFDKTLTNSIAKTARVITIEDHNKKSGLAAGVALFSLKNGLIIDQFSSLGVDEYQFSGTPKDLYSSAGVDSKSLLNALNNIEL